MRHNMFLVSLEIIWVAPKLNHVLEKQDRSSGPVNIAAEQRPQWPETNEAKLLNYYLRLCFMPLVIAIGG